MPQSRLVQRFFPASTLFAALSFLVCSVQPSARAQGKPILITPAVTIVESAQEPAAVHLATKDLMEDFSKVFGKAPWLVYQMDQAKPQTNLKDLTNPETLLIAQSAHVPPGIDCTKPTDRESFALSTTDAGVGPTHRRVVCLVGADMRGTIYAIYEFSQKVLGVDPMYLWTDKQPAKHVSITLPADFAHSYPSPVFKYRGDWLAGVYRTREIVQDYADHLKDPMAKLPAPASWSGWEAYFHIMQYEGDRSVDVH